MLQPQCCCGLLQAFQEQPAHISAASPGGLSWGSTERAAEVRAVPSQPCLSEVPLSNQPCLAMGLPCSSLWRLSCQHLAGEGISGSA